MLMGCGAAAAGASGADSKGGDQVAGGGALYGEKCATCHGPGGEGSDPTPPLIGKAALPLDARPGAVRRTMPFRTAGDVLGFLKEKHAWKASGGPTDDERATVLAFLLDANGIAVKGKPVDAASAPSIVVNPR
jgi:mono/diheme cytochrome c family protein